ncbi:MAG: PRC-barrel domain-containing protein [Candidatus Thermoplasmatota archaeon]|jgi:sporulation protein YlmC with PRC-barrel domain|nr:PRC-barrel domain-containing protein [Candidatus Thermoplasmatota archaeon]MCL5987561.1 PRC-barrel domain-containing protein [Candidatus Thermoplasmatota archaeon]
MNSAVESMKNLVGLPVYTNKGIFVGNVYDVILEMDTGDITGILIKETNEALVEDGFPIAIPYIWVKAVGDAVLLNNFPPSVKRKLIPT